MPSERVEPGDLDPTLSRSPSAKATVPRDPGAAQRRPSETGRFDPGALLADRYRIVARLGKGGMGEVYRADDLKLGESVALKFLPAAVARHPQWLARLLDEVRIARQVTHTNICRVYDISEADGEHFISMEYVDGEDLSSLIRRIGRLPEDKAIDIARQLCAGLAAAHEKGVLHRDLKPANIMLDGRGKVRITDFGLAVLSGEIDEKQIRTGTPAYMAPEQLAGREVSIRSDIYALGLVLYEVFTGKSVVEGDSVTQIERLHETAVHATPSSLVEGIDPAVERVIMRCLERDPAQRPQSVVSVSAALPGGDPLAAALAAGETPSPELVAAAGYVRPMHPGAAAAYLVVAAVLFGVLASLQSGTSLYGLVPLDKPPVVLSDHAREIVELSGYTHAPADTAFGYYNNHSYVRWLEGQGFEDIEQRLQRPSPPGIVFWYRQSPLPYRPRDSSWPGRSRVRTHEPSWSVGGEAYVELDLAGRLRFLYVNPWGGLLSEADAAKPPPDEPEWSPFFDAAGLNIDDFEPADPGRYVARRTDARRAWTGAYPDAPEIKLRIEAGYGGNAKYFRLLDPWDWPDAHPPHAPQERLRGELSQLSNLLAFLVLVSILVGAAIRLLRRRQLPHGDRRGAVRLAIYYGLCLFAGVMISGHDPPGLSTSALVLALTRATALAVAAWLLYVTLEPTIRKNWPTALMAWTRVLAGRWRDPMVGRSVLAGLLAGIGTALLFWLGIEAARHGWLVTPRLDPSWGNFSAAQDTRGVLFLILTGITLPIVMGFMYLLLLVFLRSVVRRMWLALVLVLLILPFLDFDNRSVEALPWTLVAGYVRAVLIVVLFARFGLLAVIVCLSADMILGFSPLTSDLSTWYSFATYIPAAVLGAMALFGVYAATSSRDPQRIEPVHA